MATAKKSTQAAKVAKATKSKAADPTAKRTPPTSAGTCFTIMPFGVWFDSYFESIYVPAIEAAGLKASRADDLYRPSTIIHDIWEYTQQAKVILADLSGKNPNVFYELGLAHALAKPAVIVAESMDDVPFDLRALRMILYNKNEARWGDALQQKITLALREVLSSPLESVLPAFLNVKQTAKTPAISEQDLQYLELKREVDLLRGELVSRRNPYVRTEFIDRPEDEMIRRISRWVEQGVSDVEVLDRAGQIGFPRRLAEKAIQSVRQSSQQSLLGDGVLIKKIG